MKKKVFLYVGHSNWGNSFVLKNVTYNNSRIKKKMLFGKEFRVRKMSNDDDEQKLLSFVKTVATYKYDYHLHVIYSSLCKRNNFIRIILLNQSKLQYLRSMELLRSLRRILNVQRELECI